MKKTTSQLLSFFKKSLNLLSFLAGVGICLFRTSSFVEFFKLVTVFDTCDVMESIAFDAFAANVNFEKLRM